MEDYRFSKDLRDKKKRRKAVFILKSLLIFLLAGGLGFILGGVIGTLVVMLACAQVIANWDHLNRTMQ